MHDLLHAIAITPQLKKGITDYNLIFLAQIELLLGCERLQFNELTDDYIYFQNEG